MKIVSSMINGNLPICSQLPLLGLSHVHNERTVPIIMAGCMAHKREGYISTSGLKSDVTIVFFGPDLFSFQTREFLPFGHK